VTTETRRNYEGLPAQEVAYGLNFNRAEVP